MCCLYLNISVSGIRVEDYDKRNYWRVIFPFIHQTQMSNALAVTTLLDAEKAFHRAQWPSPAPLFYKTLAIVTNVLDESRYSTSMCHTLNHLPSCQVEHGEKAALSFPHLLTTMVMFAGDVLFVRNICLKYQE